MKTITFQVTDRIYEHLGSVCKKADISTCDDAAREMMILGLQMAGYSPILHDDWQNKDTPIKDE